MHADEKERASVCLGHFVSLSLVAHGGSYIDWVSQRVSSDSWHDGETKGEPPSVSKPRWPPLAEDLRRLYLEQKLSASKIAKVYGLSYASDKTAESTVLYHLKRNGIARRDPAAHIRKVTDLMVGDWMVRYQNGESLKQIAGDSVDPVTVCNHLHKRGLQLRDKIEAQIAAVTKFEKVPFSGDKHEMAYLVGIAFGDYASTMHGRAVRVRLSTTHPAMARLFRDLFGKHGPIYEYPHENFLTEFEWSLDCDLDTSFAFLLDLKRLAAQIIADDELFFDFLAGFFDAEGSVYFHKKGSRGAFEFSLANTNVELLHEIAMRLRSLGFPCNFRRIRLDQEKFIERGIKNPGEAIWKIEVWRYETFQRLVGLLPSRHEEKIGKIAIARRLEFRANRKQREEVLEDWNALLERIDLECKIYIKKAKDTWKSKSKSVGLQITQK